MTLSAAPPNGTISTPTRSLRRRSAALSAVAVISTITAGGTAAAVTATAGPAVHLDASSSHRPGRTNPTKSIKPSADFKRYCYTPGYKIQCNIAAINNIDAGRRAEGVAPIAIPRSYWFLTVPQKLSFLANKERAVRGFDFMGTNTTLNGQAQAGAARGDDPSGPTDYAWGSNIAWGYQTALAADFGWMYDDGPGSPNVACTYSGARGCWGHRDNILANWRGAQGAGEYDNHGTLQLTQLFVANY